MTNNYELARSSYKTRQRFVCAGLGVAGTISLSTTATMAHIPGPMPNTAPMASTSHGWQTPHSEVVPFAHTNLLPGYSNWHSAGLGLHQATAPGTGSQIKSLTNSQNALLHRQATSTVRSVTQTSGGSALNLASSAQSFLADNIANFKDITIQVGGTKEIVGLNTKLTAAEVVAAEQVLTGGTQTIKLSGSGIATGGTLTLNTSLLTALDNSVGGSIGSLTISHGVEVVDTLSLLSVGSLSNYGSLLTASGTTGSTDTIVAGTILNAAGGNIGSYASGSSAGSSGIYAADPVLNALTSVTNNGSVSSAGNLTITAPVVYNVASHGSAPSITAAQNVNINTQTLNNSGAITAVSGNVNVASTAALAINGTGGTIQAQSGNINLTSNNAALTVTGDNFVSQQLNLNSGTGNITAQVDEVSGVVNASGNSIQLGANTANLNLGTIDATSDPLVDNTGDISITAGGKFVATGGGDLTLIAGENIVSASGNTGLDTSSTTGNGGSLTLVAGANFTVSGTTVTVTNSSGAGHGSAIGGYIDLTGGTGTGNGTTPLTTITTGSTAGNAGNVVMVAYAGSETNSGTVSLANSSTGGGGVGIDASSTSAGGTNGNVTIIAGATSGTAITIGNSTIGTSGSVAFLANNVLIDAYTPTAGGGVAFNTSSGTILSGSFTTSGSAQASDILVGGNTFITGTFNAYTGGTFDNQAWAIAAIGAQSSSPGPVAGAVGQDVTIIAGGNIYVGNIFAYGGGGTGSGSAYADMAGGQGGKGGDVSLSSTDGSITVEGNINVSGGGGGGGAGASEGTDATLGGDGGMAGTVTLSAAQNVTIADPILAYNGGAGGTGGSYIGGIGGGGGGGGSAIGGGGGGGGGGIGTTGFAAGGGGGFGGVLSINEYGGGGGGGSYGNAVAADATQTTGGGGASFNYGNGGYGVGNYNGDYGGGPIAGQGGAGGGLGTAPGLGGAGSTSLSVGGGGGQTSVSATGTAVGQAGGAAAAGGAISITYGGTVSSVAGGITPIDIETSTLSVYLTSAQPSVASAYINSTSGVLLTINSAHAGASGTLQITNGDSLTIPTNTGGAISVVGMAGGTIDLTTAGTGGPNSITIAGTIGGPTVNLTAGIGGAITTNSLGMIEGTTANLVAYGSIDVGTIITTVTALSSGGSVAITQANSLSLGVSSAATGFAVTSQGLISVLGAITDTSGTVQLTTSGTKGIVIGAAITTGAAGAISLNAGTTGGSITDSAGAVLTANFVTLEGTNVGTAAAPILTVANSITGKTSTTGNLIVTDSNTGTLTFDAQTASSGTLTLKSVATQLNVVEAPYATVAITVATTPSANVLLNSDNLPAVVFGGSGTFTISTTGNIDTTANTTAIEGSSVSLTSLGGSIGSLQQIATSTAGLTLKAASGSVNVTDSQATSSVSGSASPSGTFTLADTANSGTGLTITSSVNAATINLSTTASAIDVKAALTGTSAVTVESGAALTTTSAGSITGSTVSLSGVNNAGTGNAITLGGAVSAGNISVTATGSSGNMQISANIGNATSAVQITASDNIIGSTTSVVSGTTLNLTSNNGSIGTSGQAVKTAAGTLTSMAANGSSYISQTGNLNLGTSDTSSSGTFSLLVAGDLVVASTLNSSGLVSLTTTGSANILITNGAIGGAGATVALKSSGDMTINNSVTGSTITATSGGNFTQNSGGNIVGNNVALSTTGTLTANGLFEGSGTSSSLALSSGGVFTTGSSSALGTTVDPFNIVSVNVTGTGLATIGGQVNASGTGSPNGLQFITKGALVIASTAVLSDSTDQLTSSSTATIGGTITDTSLAITSKGLLTVSGTQTGATSIKSGTATLASGAALTISQYVALNDGTDSFTAKGAVAIDGIIVDSIFSLSPSGAVVIGANSSTASITTGQGTIAAPTVNNLGTLNGTGTLAITTSGTSAALTNGASGVIEGGSVTLTAGGSGQVVNSGSITPTALNIVTTNLSNTGTINTASSLSIASTSGNLTITGSSGQIATGLYGAIALTASKGSITIGTAGSGINPISLAQTNSFTVSASGNFTSPLTGVTVVADNNGNGGTINITASNIVFNGAIPATTYFLLSANGSGTGTTSGTGNGGSVTLNLSGTATTGITIGTAANNYNILASGPNGGGTVSLTTPGALTVNTADLAINATQTGSTDPGATVSFSGTKSVLIIGNLDTHFDTGSYGNITITSGAKTAFVIDGSVTTTTNGLINAPGNSGDVSLAGAIVTITDAEGVTIGTGDVLSGIGATAATSAIIINGNTLTNNGQVNTSNLTVAAAGSATIAIAGTGYSLLDSLTVSSSTGNITLSGTLPQATTINLTALNGAVNFGKVATTLSAAPEANGDGGTININAKTLTAGALTLDAAATGSGTGGTVDIDLTGTAAIKVGSGALAINVANGSGGNGGSVTIIDNGAVTVNAASLTLGSGWASGSGANLTLSAKGNLNLSNASALESGLHDVSLTSSASSFTVGGASSTGNGITGAGSTFTSDNLTIINNGGTIVKGTSAGLIGNDSLILQAKGNIGQTGTGSLLISAPVASLISTGGSIYVNDTAATTFTALQALTTLQLTAASIIAPAAINAKTINLTATSGGINSFDTNATSIAANVASGDIAITDSATALVTLNAVNSLAGNISITSAGAITTASAITASSASVSLIAGGTITTKSAITAGTDVTLQAGGKAGAIALGAGITAGSVSLTAVGAITTKDAILATTDISITSSGAITTGSSLSVTAGAASIAAGGTITTKGAITASSDVTLIAGGTAGAISVGAAISAGSNNTATLTAAGKGTIIESKTGFVVSAGTINLNGSTGNIGASHTSPFRVTATALNVNDPGSTASAFINNTSASATIGTATAGKTFDYTGVLTGTTATINAPTVLISSTSIAPALTITTNATSLQIAATSGNINVADSNSVKLNALTANGTSGTISITSSGTITTAAVISANDVNFTTSGSGNIVLGNAVTATNGTATITTLGTGTIGDAGSGTYKVTGSAVALNTQGTNIGTTKVAFRTATASLSLDTGTVGSVVVTNTNTVAAGTDTLQAANVGSLVLTDTSTSTKNTGTLIIGDIAASATAGAITISTNEQNLNVAAGSNITTIDGNITLLDTYTAGTAGKPLISIGDLTPSATTIYAGGVLGTPTGNVYIALGAVPTASTLKAGTEPTGGTPPPDINTFGTTVFFGTTSNPNGSITTGNTDILTGTGSNLSFTTGKNAATQIILGNSVSITADPPADNAVTSNATTASVGSLQGLVSLAPASIVSSVNSIAAAVCQVLNQPVASGVSTAITSNTSGSNFNANTVSAQPAVGVSLSNNGAGLMSSSLASLLLNSPSAIDASLSNLSVTSTNTPIIAAIAAIGNNQSAAVFSNLVNSISILNSDAQTVQITESNQPTLNLRRPGQSMSPTTLKGSASNIRHQSLDKGALLFNSDEKTVVDTPYGSVSLAAGSVALLVSFDQGLAVYDLHDSHKGAILINNGSGSTALVPGRSAVLTRASVKSFEEINPTQFVAYRKLASRALGSETKLYQAEFDIMSMMSGLKPLRSMLVADSPKTRKVMANALKTAVILSQLTQGGEPFNLHVAPTAMAYAPEVNR